MAFLRIAQVGHPVLRAPTRTLTVDEIHSDRWQRFFDDLIDTMHEANGAGLAANQVYESVRVCAIEVKPNNPRYPYKPPIPLTLLVNPVITPLSDETFLNYEGCLSVPDMRGEVPRFARVRVEYLDRHANPVVVEQRGITAGTFQHEVDHLDGKVFLDRVTDPTSLTTWTNFDRFQKDGFAARVKDIVEKYGS